MGSTGVKAYEALAIKAIRQGLEPASDHVAIENYKKIGLSNRIVWWWRNRGEVPLMAKYAVAWVLYDEQQKLNWTGRSLLK